MLGFSVRGQKKCPGGSKQRYETREQAEIALQLARAHRAISQASRVEDHAYACDRCSGFHLTSKVR